MSGTESGGGGNVVWVDITAMSPRNDAVAMAKVMGRVVGLSIAASAAVLGWLVLVVMVTNSMSDAVQMFGLFGLIVAPFLYLVWKGMLVRDRWESGVSDFPSSADFSPAENARKIPYLDVTRKELLDSLQNLLATKRGAGPIVDEGKLRRELLIQYGGAILLCALGIALGYHWVIVPVAIALPFIWLNVRRRSLPDLDTVVARDRRPPVLLLRSFRDEYVRVPFLVAARFGPITPERRLEQGLTILNALGPLIAIGNPGEKLPHIGAARALFPEGEWQPAVLRFMDEAIFIAMIAGDTRWISWELERIVEKGGERKLAIVLPPSKYPGRWQNVLAALAKTRWAPALQSIDPADLLLAQLRADGSILVVGRTGKPFIQDYQLALAIALYQEFCKGEAQAIPLPPPAG